MGLTIGNIYRYREGTITGEVLATRSEEITRGALTVDDLARQMADLRRQVENIKPGADDRVSIIVFKGEIKWQQL